MTVDDIDIEAAVQKAKTLLSQEKGLSPSFKMAMDVLLLLVGALLNRLNLNSRNSSKPPSSDPNRQRTPKTGSRPRGGQKGHNGTTLEPVSDPDEIVELSLDRAALPAGRYRVVGFEARQLIDIDIARFVTEYRAEILEDEHGQRYTAPFPRTLTRPVQYGDGVKAHAVYLSQYQLLPYKRVEEYFADRLALPLSAGSIFNFNQEAGRRLEDFDHWVKAQLHSAAVLHADETGINIDGKRHWLHCASSELYTCFQPHGKRGQEAMDAMGILPGFQGILCHDHWKPYYRFDCLHALCNAHHLRELERAWEQDAQQWAKAMQELLLEINQAVEEGGGCLSEKASEGYRTRYRTLLRAAEEQCPPPEDSQRKKGRRGRLKRSKSRNLLERLRDFEDDVLRFTQVPAVPFTNNQGENDIRMTKLQQKISGCFRSFEGAQIFCRVRSYLSTCRKHGVCATEALRLLFNGQWPTFMMADDHGLSGTSQ